jgi:hypothetical protein
MKLVNPRSRLTPGNLLLCIQRLTSVPFDDEKQALIDHKIALFKTIRQEWKSHWMQKAQQEFSARMDLWQLYLQDLFEDRSTYAINYAYAIRWRVILQLIENDGIRIKDISRHVLFRLDETLKANTTSSSFIWGEYLKSSFPEPTYWFLYREVSRDR